MEKDERKRNSKARLQWNCPSEAPIHFIPFPWKHLEASHPNSFKSMYHFRFLCGNQNWPMTGNCCLYSYPILSSMVPWSPLQISIIENHEYNVYIYIIIYIYLYHLISCFSHIWGWLLHVITHHLEPPKLNPKAWHPCEGHSVWLWDGAWAVAWWICVANTQWTW